MDAGPVGASSSRVLLPPLEADVMMLAPPPPCLLDVLGRRRREPDRVVLVEEGGMATRVVPPLWVTFDCSTTGLFGGLTMPCASRMLPCPVGEGNWVSLKSVDADSRLLWRSSKLTEGRKSNEPELSTFAEVVGWEEALAFRPKENRD